MNKKLLTFKVRDNLITGYLDYERDKNLLVIIVETDDSGMSAKGESIEIHKCYLINKT